MMQIVGCAYLAVGLTLAVFMTNGSNLLGKAIVVFIWPYVALVCGTPRVRWLTHLSGQEIVIEEGEEVVSGRLVTKQTVRQYGGYEYTRVKQ